MGVPRASSYLPVTIRLVMLDLIVNKVMHEAELFNQGRCNNKGIEVALAHSAAHAVDSEHEWEPCSDLALYEHHQRGLDVPPGEVAQELINCFGNALSIVPNLALIVGKCRSSMGVQMKRRVRGPTLTKAELGARGEEALATVTKPVVKLPTKLARGADRPQSLHRGGPVPSRVRPQPPFRLNPLPPRIYLRGLILLRANWC
jgi:hypothetical protein